MEHRKEDIEKAFAEVLKDPRVMDLNQEQREILFKACEKIVCENPFNDLEDNVTETLLCIKNIISCNKAFIDFKLN